MAGLAELVRHGNTTRATANDNVVVCLIGSGRALHLGAGGAMKGFTVRNRNQGTLERIFLTYPSQVVVGLVLAKAAQVA